MALGQAFLAFGNARANGEAIEMNIKQRCSHCRAFLFSERTLSC